MELKTTFKEVKELTSLDMNFDHIEAINFFMLCLIMVYLGGGVEV